MKCGTRLTPWCRCSGTGRIRWSPPSLTLAPGRWRERPPQPSRQSHGTLCDPFPEGTRELGINIWAVGGRVRATPIYVVLPHAKLWSTDMSKAGIDAFDEGALRIRIGKRLGLFSDVYHPSWFRTRETAQVVVASATPLSRKLCSKQCA